VRLRVRLDEAQQRALPLPFEVAEDLEDRIAAASEQMRVVGSGRRTPLDV
jgi:hypothetical protein